MTITVMWITIQILAQSLVRSQCPSNPQQQLLILAESQYADEVVVVGAFDRHANQDTQKRLDESIHKAISFSHFSTLRKVRSRSFSVLSPHSQMTIRFQPSSAHSFS